jgi:ubiquinone/menaquinone biosynthesis C-methylase UbiE
VGVDISEGAINFATANYTSPNLRFEVGDILDMGFSDNRFDVITCFETVEHVLNQEECFSELYRVLSEGGTLLISSPNRKLTSPSKSVNDRPDNRFHTKEYLTNEFVLLISEYFEICGVYGQRRMHKVLLQHGIEQAARYFFPMFYRAHVGHPLVEPIAAPYEYRYITIVCRK